MDVINVGTEEDELFPIEPLDIDVVVKLTVGDKMHYKLVISYLMLGSTSTEDVVVDSAMVLNFQILQEGGWTGFLYLQRW